MYKEPQRHGRAEAENRWGEVDENERDTFR